MSNLNLASLASLSLSDVVAMPYKGMRSLATEIGLSPIPRKKADLSASFAEIFEGMASSESKKPGRTNVWAARIALMLSAVPDSADHAVISAVQMQNMGFPNSCLKFAAYWGQNPAGRACRAAGWIPSLRRIVRGEEAVELHLTRIVEA